MNKTTTKLVILFICFLAVNQVFAERFLRGDSLEMIAFREDNVAFLKGEYVYRQGLASMSKNAVLIVDTNNKEIIETLTVENREETYEDLKTRGYTFIESIQYADHTSQVHSQGTLKDLKSKGYPLIKIASQPLPEGVVVDYIDKPIEGKDNPLGNYLLSFFLRHEDENSKFKIHLETRTHRQNQSKAAGGEEGFFGLPYTWFGRGQIFNLPNQTSYIVLYHEPHVFEDIAGETGVLVINQHDLSRFYNARGFDHYNRREIKLALDHFLFSLSYNPQNATANYNTACMYGLSEDVSKAVEYLNRLEDINSEKAREYLRKAKTDHDFNNVRHHQSFQKFK